MTRARPSDINLNEVAHPKVLDAFFREIVRSHPEFANMSRKDLERYLREMLADLAKDPPPASSRPSPSVACASGS